MKIFSFVKETRRWKAYSGEITGKLAELFGDPGRRAQLSEKPTGPSGAKAAEEGAADSPSHDPRRGEDKPRAIFVLRASDWITHKAYVANRAGSDTHGAAIRFDAETDDAIRQKVLFYGPYARLPAGRFAFTFDGELDGEVDLVFTADAGKRKIARTTLSGFAEPVTVDLPEPLEGFEILGRRTLALERLALRGAFAEFFGSLPGDYDSSWTTQTNESESAFRAADGQVQNNEDARLPALEPDSAEALRSWLRGLETDAANALLPAINDGVFDKFIPTTGVVDVCLDSQDRRPILPSVTQIKIPAAAKDYADILSGERDELKAVVLANVLEHVVNPFSLLRSAHEHLAVGAHLIISVPHRDLYERRLFPPSRFAAEHRRFYTLDRLLLHIEAACGVNSFRLRFAKDYDAGHDYQAPHSEQAHGAYSTLAIFEKMGRREQYEDYQLIQIDRIPQYAELEEDSIVVATPKSLLSAGITISDITKIIVLKIDHIGDFCMMVPQFGELRATFPSAAITLVCGSWNEELASSLNLFDSIVTCDYFAQDEKFRGSRDREKSFQAQQLGSRLKGQTFDLAIDFRVPSDSRRLLQVIDSRIRAGIGDSHNFKYLDVALPTLESYHQAARRDVPSNAHVSWSPAAFNYKCRHWLRDGLALCEPADKKYFIYGPYTKIDSGGYDGVLNLQLVPSGEERRVEVVFDIATNAGQIVFAEKYLITETECAHKFRFDAFVGLADVEFRARLNDLPATRTLFVFTGVDLDFASASQARRIMPTASVHMAEQITMLLALVRSRLVDAIDVAAIRSRFSRGSEPVAVHKYVAIAPVSNSLLRDWPADEYIDLGRAILASTSADLLLIGSGGQKAELNSIANDIVGQARRERVNVLAGAGWSEVLPKLIAAEATITNNSGIAHVAALVGARSISIYSASHQAIEWGPLGRDNVTVQAKLGCGPCGFDTLDECSNGHRCMRGISHKEVLEVLRRQCGGLFGKNV